MTQRTSTWLSWSSGKDSYAALLALSDSPTHRVDSLFTVIDGDRERVPMHAVSVPLLQAQARALGVQLRQVVLHDNAEVQPYHALLQDARRSGVDCFAFGDLFLDDVRQRREDKMQTSGIDLLFPLWLLPTEPLIRSLLHRGMRALITSVDLEKLPQSFLGREIMPELVDELIQRGCDPCGEYGEFHSFVYDGSLFSHPVVYAKQPILTDGRFAHLPLRSV